MIQYYKTVEGQLLEQNCASPGVWIHLNRPTKEEIEEVCAQTGVLVDLLTAALDEEEAARIEREEDQTLVLVDIPVVERNRVAGQHGHYRVPGGYDNYRGLYGEPCQGL